MKHPQHIYFKCLAIFAAGSIRGLFILSVSLTRLKTWSYLKL